MKALETVLHLRRQHPKRVRHMVPQHVRRLVAAYDLRPTVEERRRDGGVTDSRPSAEL
jgi:coenzyme F420 hydrogenase subunit beta